jgi:hypothetical protein
VLKFEAEKVKVAKFNLAVFKAGHPQKGIWKQSAHYFPTAPIYYG